METEKAIEELKAMKSCKGYKIEIRDYEIEIIETVLQELKKQEKMIELMSEELAFGVFDFKSKEQAKQYFEKKAEEAE